ncbi:MAG: hypothetical protein NTZ34_02965, partial [Chloroflexi bacterium]|nr:hypothetical protein [Chloroflexota bacterium]
LKTIRPDISESEFLPFCQKYQRIVRELHCKIVKFMPRVSEREFPPEIVRPIELFIREIESNFALILDPCDGKTFEIQAWPNIYAEYLDQLEPYVPQKYHSKRDSYPKLFIFLSFPKYVARSPLLHSITMSHEILHLKDAISGMAVSLCNQITIPKQDFDKLVDEILTSKIPVPGNEHMLMPRTYADFYSRDVMELAVMQQCTDVISHWLKELVADLLAVRLFGPVYLFAFADHSLALGVMDVDSDKHPNSRMRLSLMLDELRNLGYFHTSKTDEKMLSRLKTWHRFAKARRTLQQESHHVVIHSSINSSLSTVVARIRSETTGKEYDYRKFSKEVVQLIELLKNGIPPCELVNSSSWQSTPASLPGILNAGTIVQADYLGAIADLLHVSGESGEFECKRKLDELLLKAIEAIEVWRIWPAKEG